jgi:large conductance mechanosensitive channel
MGWIKEFKEFALKGNVVDMAVGIVIGAAFSGIVTSLVKDLMTPPIGWVMGGVDFKDKFILIPSDKAPGPFTSLAEAQAAGAATINYGQFVNACISFTIVAFALFMLVKVMNRIRRKAEEAPPAPPKPTKDQELLSEIRDLLKAQGGQPT